MVEGYCCHLPELVFAVSVPAVGSVLAEALELPVGADGSLLEVWGVREFDWSVGEVAGVAFEALALLEQHAHLLIIKLV